MNKRKSVIIMLIVFLVIGFATVSTTLVLNGILAVGENKDDFNVIFTSAKLDGRKRNDFISEDKKHINFVSNELKTLDDKAILTYEITNTSRNYDADIILTCTAGTTELITLEYTPHQMEVPAGETKSGTLTISMLKLVDSPIEVPVEFTFNAAAKERVDLGEEYVEPFSRSGVMKIATNNYSTPTGMWSYRSNITKVEFEDKLIPKETTEDLIFDVSDKQDKSVMAYLIPNEGTLTTNKDHDNKDLTNTTAYTLYIQGDTGVIANTNSSNIFAYFNNLKEVKNFQYLDTSNVTIMSDMFYNCLNLTTLDVSNFDTSKAIDMSSMFYNCSNLTTIDVSNFDTSNVISINFMFASCSSLKELNVSNFITDKITDMSHMFEYCSQLTSLDVSNFNTSNVKDMSCMFHGSKNLIKLDLSNFRTPNLTSMLWMFARCDNLAEINISNFDVSNVTTLGGLFAESPNIAKVDISNWNIETLADKEIVTKEAFTASKLTDVKIYVKDKTAQDWVLSLPDTSRPSSWTTDNVVIKEAA